MLSCRKGRYGVFDKVFLKVREFNCQSITDMSIYTCNPVLDLTAWYRDINDQSLEPCQNMYTQALHATNLPKQAILPRFRHYTNQ